tara:strand:+ start:1733 stop:2023 length:291 start_codon:yes stop_codon:yes gene_type:complete
MSKVKLKSGKEVTLKKLSIDERDALLDGVEYKFDKDGNPLGMKMMHTTVTKCIRIAVEGDTSDKFLETLTFEDRTDIFLAIQNSLFLGEEKASSSD